jgi:hydroxyethylthiazole kinase-like uncharacterized protein yjeF
MLTSRQSKASRRSDQPAPITRALLQSWPLPDLNSADDKEDRGTVLVIGGSRSLPGAVILSGTAALRSGAGKLQIATSKSVSPHVAIAVPESMTIGLDDTAEGLIDPVTASAAARYAKDANVVVIGPGMESAEDTTAFVTSLLPLIEHATVVIDAGAIAALRNRRDLLDHLGEKAILTPHPGEMASLMDTSRNTVANDPAHWAKTAASELEALVVLKGPQTFIAEPGEKLFEYRGGGIGLATSGSGDTLAGIIAGLLGRRCSPVQAAAWGVWAHGEAGIALAEKFARVGFLAREILDEVPAVLESI